MTETAARGHGKGAFRRVLVGFDGSHGAQEALRAGIALAEELEGDLRVLLVVRPPAHAETPEELVDAAAVEQERLSEGLSSFRLFTGRDIDRRVVHADDPARALAEHAEEHGFDIVVVGRHGRDHGVHRGIGHSLEALLRHHRTALLVV